MNTQKITEYLKRRKWLLLFLVIFMAGAGYFYFKVMPHAIDNVVVKMVYEIPGPIDDPPYKIISFIKSKKKYPFLVNKFIPVYFESSKLAKQVDGGAIECGLYMDYFFTGSLMYSKYTGYFLLVKSAKLKKTKTCK
jgi:hypothetical protein